MSNSTPGEVNYPLLPASQPTPEPLQGFEVGLPKLPPPLVVITQAKLLALLERLWPEHYLAPMRDNAPALPGYELPQSFAAIFERCSQAIVNNAEGLFFLTAKGAARAEGYVDLFRQNAGAGVVVVKSGTIVSASKSGLAFATAQDATFTGEPADPNDPAQRLAAYGPLSVKVVALLPGWDYNLRGQRTTAGGEMLPGEIDTILKLYEDPILGDITMQVRQVVDTVGGRAPMLDILGGDRGIVRLPNEGDDQYRARILTIVDTVSPGAIRRTVEKFLSPYNLKAADIIETWETRYQTCWDAPDNHIPNSDFDPTCFVYDDPRTDKFRNRWLDENDEDGAFIVVVPDLIGAVTDYGMAWDDPADTADGLLFSAQGSTRRRSISAFDLPDALPSDILMGAFDGDDRRGQSVYAGLNSVLQDVKAAGVNATIELEGE